MRIISGKYKGRNILSPVGNDVRPTSDKTKESIFNVIQWSIAGSRFVDLFAGSGSIGIEAISRGAEEVVFIDSNRKSIELVTENLKNIAENYRIINRDYKDALNTLSGQFDFIFVDAPFDLKCIDEICQICLNKNILTENGLIIYEHHRDFSYNLSQDWIILKSRKSGLSVVDYISKCKSICAVTGSFDPITLGHMDIIKQAMNDFDRVNIVIANNDKKAPIFDIKTRKAFVEEACKGLPNLKIDVCDGFVYKYCNDNNIKDIVRGYRDDKDFAYEREMEIFNQEKGNIQTHLFQAQEKYVDISSSKVKQALVEKTSLKALVPKNILKMVEKQYNQKYNK